MKKREILKKVAAVAVAMTTIVAATLAPVGKCAKVQAATIALSGGNLALNDLDVDEERNVELSPDDTISFHVTNNNVEKDINQFNLNPGTTGFTGFDSTANIAKNGGNRTITLTGKANTSGTVIITLKTEVNHTLTLTVHVTVTPGAGGAGGAGAPNDDNGRYIPPHSHDNPDNGEWTTFGNPDDPNGGYEELRCKYCGEVMEVRWINAYYIYNRNTANKIKNAPYGATVKAETDRWVSYHKMVFDELAKRPDVTLITDYTCDHVKYEMVIAAGAYAKPANAAATLDENGYAGYRRISTIYPTTLRQ